MTRKLQISFNTSEDTLKTKTINNVRLTATDDQLRGFVSLYDALTEDAHFKTTLVESRVL